MTNLLLFMNIHVFAESSYSGKCGEHSTWELNSNYVLSISGYGDMDDYINGADRNIPWIDYYTHIKSIIVNEGISHIGNSSFARCSAISVKLPESLNTIGELAFSNCDITTVQIPAQVTCLSYGVFSGCTSLQSIRLHKNITKIEENAFNKCTALKTVYYYGTEEEYDDFINNGGLTNGNEPFIAAEKVFIPEVLPTSISISTKPTYIIGEDTALDIAVNLNHNDGTTTTLSPDEYTLETDFNPNIEGEYNVKVTYGEFTDEVKVNVEPLKMVSIAITTSPEKTEFVEGTELDLSGMVVTGTYNNGKTEEITDYTVSGYDSAKTGNQTLTISYNGLTVSLPVTVAKKSISGINITSLPDKLYYCNDETELDLTGFAVEMLYDNGTTSECTGYTISGFDGTRTGTQTITVSYRGFTDTFEIEVKRYDFKTDSNISKQYDFDTKTLSVGTHITSRTDAKAVKVIVAVYDENNALMGVKMANTFFDTNETKDLSIGVENVVYPFDKVKVFVWDFDLGKMLPLAVGI